MTNLLTPEPHLPSAALPTRAFLRVTLSILLGLALPVLAYRLYIRSTASGSAPQPTLALSLAMGLLEFVVLAGSVYLFGLWWQDLPWSTAGIRRTSPDWIVHGFALGVLAIPLTGLVALAMQLIFRLPQENPQLPFLAPAGFSWPAALGMLLLGGFLAPFAEELYFRGILYPWIRQRWGVWPGILCSAFIFGLIHADLAVGSAAFVLGIVMAWSYERSASLWPAVIIHIINNSAKIILLYALLALGLLPT